MVGERAARRADDLLDTFGSIAALVSVRTESLAAALGSDGHLAPIIVAARNLVQAGMREKIQRGRVSSADPALLEYLISIFAGLHEEHLRVLFLDGQHGLIAEDRYSTGEIGSVWVRPRILFARTLEVGARAIVLAHNHPSGDAAPSQLDIQATAKIVADARPLEIELIDHLIVAGSQVFSMKRAGIL